MIQSLIYLHATLGGISLLSGAIALIAKKGSNPHRKAGKWFFFSMLGSAVLGTLVTTLPDHENPFLMLIGLFSLYFVITGFRALKYRIPNPSLTLDKWISRFMIIIGLGMIIYPIAMHGKFNIVLGIFGIAAIFFAAQDLVHFRDGEKLRKDYLKKHLLKMISAYISAVSAFLVVNELFTWWIGWIAPGVIGGFYIAWWIGKVEKGEI